MQPDESDEQRALRAEARAVVESELQPFDDAIERTGEVPSSAVDAMRRAGF